MRKTGYYGMPESHECTKWWNMPPALRISRFISNGSAQSGKLIKVCSRACTKRAATAQGGCCCSVQASKRDFILIHFHVWTRHVHIPPLRRWQSVSASTTSSLTACAMPCILPQRKYHWCKGTCKVSMNPCVWWKAHKGTSCVFQLSRWTNMVNCNVDEIPPIAILLHQVGVKPRIPALWVGSNKAPLLTIKNYCVHTTIFTEGKNPEGINTLEP